MQRIDGAAVAAKVMEETKARIAALAQRGVRPGLAVVLVGDDPASRAYVRSKDRKAAELGLHSVKHELPADTDHASL
jgi:methylenetetrahydrofolate dehydrogenase (NADP+)/methenyltetrahydrofolate cyclohydrolase